MNTIESKIFLDSSAWLAYFLAENEEVKNIIDANNSLSTSIISLFEIKRKLLKEKYLQEKIATALKFIKTRSLIINLNEDITEQAANISVQEGLAAIDSLIYTSAQKNKSLLVTGDNDFRKLNDVKIIQ